MPRSLWVITFPIFCTKSGPLLTRCIMPGLPHFSNQEDEYGGYRIPKNTLVIGNVW